MATPRERERDVALPVAAHDVVVDVVVTPTRVLDVEGDHRRRSTSTRCC